MTKKFDESVEYKDYNTIECGCGGSDRCIMCGGDNVLVYYDGDFRSIADMAVITNSN